jgi:excisionase family DNA binding protein
VTPSTSSSGVRAVSPKLRLLSTSTVANRLGVSARTIRLWAEYGEIPALKVGRQWRIEDSAFSQWFSARQKTSDHPRFLRK